MQRFALEAGGIREIAACVHLLLALCAPASAQSRTADGEGPTTLGVYGGAWSEHAWPRGALSLDHGLGTFVARLEAWAVSRTVVLCDGGADEPLCDERKLLRGLSLGGRLMDRDGRWHPFGGAGLGITKYYDTETQLYLEVGARFDVRPRWGAEIRGGLDLPGGAAAFLDVGAWYSLWQ